MLCVHIFGLFVDISKNAINAQQKIRSKPFTQNACNMFGKCLVLSLCLALVFAQTCDSNANRIDCKQYSQSTVSFQQIFKLVHTNPRVVVVVIDIGV